MKFVDDDDDDDGLIFS